MLERFSLGLVFQTKESVWPVQPCTNRPKEETVSKQPSEGRQDGKVVEQVKARRGFDRKRKTYKRKFPLCSKFGYHHVGSCGPPGCFKCCKNGHRAKNYKANFLKTPTSHGCGELGLFKANCPRRVGKHNLAVQYGNERANYEVMLRGAPQRNVARIGGSTSTDIALNRGQLKKAVTN
ncbi:hypothetical protein L1987_12514 [Smallanthus sonchifolius]|uniref:Uncharacterized protein n=1 Tax=Smallanthus sonchifolius TaxID=185202 RepID=A0ACB9JEE4_9ASTR|nr:hypothetical protein L1987_12514 [Smallanthus sonchifolius]